LDNAVKPAQPHLEVANAAPVRVNQRSASQRFADIPCVVVEQSQSGNEIETFQGGNESVGESSRLDLLFH